MADWYDPATWAQTAKTAASLVSTLAKLRGKVSKKQIGPGRQGRDRARESDTTQKELQQFIDQMTVALQSLLQLAKIVGANAEGSEARFKSLLRFAKATGEAIRRLQDQVAAHEAELKKLKSGRAAKRSRKRKRRPKSR